MGILSMKIQTGDIVKFIEIDKAEASQFCIENNLTGKVVGFYYGKTVVDFGLGYLIYADKNCLAVVTKRQDIPPNEPDGEVIDEIEAK